MGNHKHEAQTRSERLICSMDALTSAVQTSNDRTASLESEVAALNTRVSSLEGELADAKRQLTRVSDQRVNRRAT